MQNKRNALFRVGSDSTEGSVAELDWSSEEDEDVADDMFSLSIGEGSVRGPEAPPTRRWSQEKAPPIVRQSSDESMMSK